MQTQRTSNIPKHQNLCTSTMRTNQLRVSSVQFGLLSPDEVQRLSVAEINSEIPYDEKGNPRFNGINDPRLGTNSKDCRCITCKGSLEECPGHFGHIELAKGVYHAGLLTYITKALRSVCFNCSRLLIARDKSSSDYKFLISSKSAKQKFNYVYNTTSGKEGMVCDPKTGGCGYKQPKLAKQGLAVKVEYLDENFDQTKDRKQILYADECFEVLRKIRDEDLQLMGFNKEQGRPEWMIIKNLAVAPPPVRPSVAMPNCYRCEDDLTYAYQQIIKMNNLLRSHIEKGTNQSTINEILAQLQYLVATLMDNDICGQPKQKHKSGKQLKSIRARLKGKEGRLRGNLMGKRVDFSSRTVITPDPNLQLDELGVPLDIATNLTFPETVTMANYDEMKKLIQNGPQCWPGAKYIIRHDERQIDLSALRNRSDAHIEVGYKVERHLRDGDYVIFNRQPSLHKMSIMGHRVKILPYSTFRMNLSVTSPYNADFDGDEMNMHVPQGYETIAEIKELMSVPKQIMNPQSNKPIMGIVQDSLLGAMVLTSRDTFIGLEDMMNLVMWIDDYESLPQPAILKPVPLWTGKQIFSIVLPKIQYVRYNETSKAHNWASVTDKNVLIQNGELLCGQLTKGQVGNTGGGLVHIIWKEYGSEACKAFLSQSQSVINNWLVMHGFTVGVSDIIARQQTMALIRSTLQKQLKKVQRIVQNSQIGKLKSQPGKSMIESFEAQINQQLNDARDKSGNIALEDLSNTNRLRNMVQAGSKGNNINISQIMACVGQQNVEGKRIPFGFNKRTLPHFAKDDFGPESKGFVENSYFRGLSPQELYFHAMGGREGLIDTAVKTAETGYLSRKLMKALEDVMVKYDGSVRTSREHIIQFIYGEDGVSGEHVEDMTIDLMKMDDHALDRKYNFLSRDLDQEGLSQVFQDPETAKEILSDPIIAKTLRDEFESIKQDRETLRNSIFKMTSDDSIHMPINLKRIIQNAKRMFEIGQRAKSDLRPVDVVQKLEQTLKELCVIPGLQGRNHQLLLDANADSTMLLRIYIKSILNSKNVIMNEKLNSSSFDWILGEIKAKFEQSLVHPGEMVGSVAAQSLGEPATQMTLNTFHFAGVSAKNVTLGVPRMKEIINVSKNIKTPSLKIFLQEKYRKREQVVTKLGGLIEYTTLQHVVSSSQIFYDPDPKKTIIKADEELVALYNEVPVLEDTEEQPNPWVVRFELDNEKMVHKDLSISAIDKIIHDSFLDQINVMHSDENAERQVIRMRIGGIEDDEEETAAQYLKQFEQGLLHDMAIKGLPEISKVTFTKHIESGYDSKTGKFKQSDDNWIIETDGVALQRILTFPKVDHRCTVSNDCLEIKGVLGIEAARQSLINEFRFVLGSYGIYVNYRHLATLTDVMTQRGQLMSIARHGINRIDSGAIRKCSFEETVEILLEAAVHSEDDTLSGITENIVMGQLTPMGTGSFGLTIDAGMIKTEAQSEKERYGYDFDDIGCGMYLSPGGPSGARTPMQPESERVAADILGGGATSVYGQSHRSGMTPGPGFDMGFSPHNLGSPNFYASPAHYQASPGYGSPMGASPIYMNPGLAQSPAYAGASPIYQPGGSSAAGNQNLHAGLPQSPQYSLNPPPSRAPYQSNQKPYSPVYGQSLPGAGGVSSVGRSPGYSPTGMLARGSLGPSPQSLHQHSPAYSPTSLNARVANAGASPAYNQMTMAGISPQGGHSPYHHSPENPGISPHRAGPGSMISPNPASSVQMPGRQGGSPAYNPISPSYQGGLPGPNHSSPMQGQQPSSRPGDPYCPLSPAYTPQQPKKDK